MTLYYATSNDPEVVKDILTNGIRPDNNGIIVLGDVPTIAGKLFINTSDYDGRGDDGFIQVAVFKCDIRFTDDDGPLGTVGGYGIHETIQPDQIDTNVDYINYPDNALEEVK